MPYFQSAGGGADILLSGILILIFLIFISIFIINKKVKVKTIKNAFYIALFLQIIILLIDNYIKPFPTLEFDPRAFEHFGWYSYQNDMNMGRGIYNEFFINPIYKLIKIRVALLFGAINIFFHIIININLFEILKKIIKNRKIINICMYISILSPMTLINRAGILRESIIVLLLSYSLKYFIKYIYGKNNINIILAILLIGLTTLFHGGCLFLGLGYALYLLKGQKNQKVLQIIIFTVAIVMLFVFKDRLLLKIGGGDIENILEVSNSKTLRAAGSAYLKNVQMNSTPKLILFLPLKIFYFLYSPTPDMFRGPMDIGVFLINSTIYIFLTYGIFKYRKKIVRKLNIKEEAVVNYLLISIIAGLIVFSIGTHNAGTAVRHRDKIMIFFIVVYAVLRNRYEIERKKNVRRDI